jgi:hypothetical protein
MQPAHQTRSENIQAQPIKPPKMEPAAAIDLHVHVKQAHSNVLRHAVIASQEHARVDVWVNEGGAGGEVIR